MLYQLSPGSFCQLPCMVFPIFFSFRGVSSPKIYHHQCNRNKCHVCKCVYFHFLIKFHNIDQSCKLNLSSFILVFHYFVGNHPLNSNLYIYIYRFTYTVWSILIHNVGQLLLTSNLLLHLKIKSIQGFQRRRSTTHTQIR